MTETTRQAPRLLDCRKSGYRMTTLSFVPRDGGRKGTVAAHEGTKPVEGDYLALDGDDGKGDALYRVTSSDWCGNVDPANMWIARVEFVPGSEAASLVDLPNGFDTEEIA